jgi:hypothetical protein
MNVPSVRRLASWLAASAAAVAAVMVFVPAGRAAATQAVPLSVAYSQFQNGKGKCLDVAGQANGSVVQQFTCNGTVNQQWTRQPTDNGWFRLAVASSGRCLEVEGASQAVDHQVQIADCNNAFNQQWTDQPSEFRNGRIIIARHSGLCLDILGRSQVDRVPAVQSVCKGLSLTGSWVVSSPTPVYFQVRDGSGKCLDAGGQANGSVVQQFTCNGTVNQQWTEQPTDNGWFRLAVASSGRCLEVEGASQAQGHRVQIGDCTSAFNQQWAQRPSGFLDLMPILVARHSGMCLDIAGHEADDRAPAIQSGCNGNLADQRWSIS